MENQTRKIGGIYEDSQKTPHSIYHVCQLGWRDQTPSSEIATTPEKILQVNYQKINSAAYHSTPENEQFIEQQTIKFKQSSPKIPNTIKGFPMAFYSIK